MKVDLARIRELIAVVAESRVTELTVRGPEGTITVCRNLTHLPAAVNGTPVVVEANGQPASEAAAADPPREDKIAVRSPAVGFVRLQAGTAVNSKVEAGDLICIVESMSVPMEVHAPCAGRLAAIEVQVDQPVEYGQPLMWIEPT